MNENKEPIWKVVTKISAQVPKSEWAKLPTDLARSFDYYQKQKKLKEPAMQFKVYANGRLFFTSKLLVVESQMNSFYLHLKWPVEILIKLGDDIGAWNFPSFSDWQNL